MMPVAAYNLLQSIDILSKAVENFNEQCIKGLKSTSKGPSMVEQGLSIVTTLVPHIGYDASASLAKEAQALGKTVKEVALEKTDFSADELDVILDPEKMTKPSDKL